MRTKAPKRRPHAHLLPTLFDRLRDEAPHRQHEPAEAYTATRMQMREIVQRDLTYLFNTTNREHEMERTYYPNVASSTLNYGMPSLAGGYLSEQKWADMAAVIRRAIVDFEPRLIADALTISPVPERESRHHYNVLLFEIRGMIHMDPYPMAFTAHSAFDLETNRMTMRFLDGA
ncbi:MAG: type VI secretion system baseplate subunit TssE [Rhodocyclaceae bacterium]